MAAAIAAREVRKEAGFLWPALIGILNSVLSLAARLRIAAQVLIGSVA